MYIGCAYSVYRMVPPRWLAGGAGGGGPYHWGGWTAEGLIHIYTDVNKY